MIDHRQRESEDESQRQGCREENECGPNEWENESCGRSARENVYCEASGKEIDYDEWNTFLSIYGGAGRHVCQSLTGPAANKHDEVRVWSKSSTVWRREPSRQPEVADLLRGCCVRYDEACRGRKRDQGKLWKDCSRARQRQTAKTTCAASRKTRCQPRMTTTDVSRYLAVLTESRDFS